MKPHSDALVLRLRRGQAWAVMGLAILAVSSSACGTSHDQRVASEGPAATADVATSLDATTDRIGPTETYQDLTFEAPGPDQSPGVSKDQVFATIQAKGVYPELAKTKQTPEVKFGLFTDPHYGPLDEKGNVQPTYVKRPVWMVHYTGLPPVDQSLMGGYSPPNEGTTLAPDLLSVDVIIICDATTGELLQGDTFATP